MKPNLFIVGSMKCGTTALYDFLAIHPGISGSKPKEIHYFTLNQSKDEAWYLSHFKENPEAQYLLEASPSYFDTAWEEDIPRRIQNFNPEAKIIIMIRDPLIRAISHFYHLRTRGKVAELQNISFTQLARSEWPAKANIATLEEYRSRIMKFSLYARKIENYVNVFGAKNVFLIENEAMMTNGEKVVNDLLANLGLHSLPGSVLSKKGSMVGVPKKPEDESDNREQFEKTHAHDYERARRMTTATRIGN
jgi:hypothetical protein